MSNTIIEPIWNIEGNLFNGFPATTDFLTGGTINVEPSFTRLPLPTNFQKYDCSIIAGVEHLFNGFPALSKFIESKSLKEVHAQCNLPIHPLFPLPIYCWHVENELFDNMPITIYHNPTFMNDIDIHEYSNAHYLTPLQAKKFIVNYMIKKAKEKAVKYSKQIKNRKVIGHNNRIEVNWEDPIEDENWKGTLLLFNKTKFPTKEHELGTEVLASTSKSLDGRMENKYKTTPFKITGLENGKTYYVVIATFNKNRQLVINAENKFKITPKLNYEKIYDDNGRLIEVRPIL